jgi:hypothetical protein
MTDDKRRYFPIGKGRLTFDADALPPGRPLDGFQRYSGTISMKIDMPPFRMAQRDPIPYLVGYDPQKLLPAPGSNPEWFRRDFLAFFAAQLGTPYMTENIFRPSDFSPNEMIDFETISPTARSIDFTKLYEDMPPRTATEARNAEYAYKRAVIVVGGDLSRLEARVLAAMAMPKVIAVELDMRDAFGEIRYNRAVTDAMLSCYLKPGPKPKAVKQNGRPAGYLDHDPTKKHKRRKRK